VRSYLVVANQTLGGPKLRDEITKRLTAGPSSFYVLVPNTRIAAYEPAGLAPMPDTTEEAQHRLDQLLANLHNLGVKAEGALGDANPLKAIAEVLASRQFDEVLLSTLPHHVSKWLRMDLPHRVQRRFGLPVTTIITST
jgi:hypothetical protein